MSAVYIEVKGYGGEEVEDCITDAVRLATRLGCDVWGDFNGVRTLAQPGDDAKVLHLAWKAELESDRQYKTASTNRALLTTKESDER